MSPDQRQPDQQQPNQPEPPDQQQPPALSFKEFLEKASPVTTSDVEGIICKEKSRGGGDHYSLRLPPTLELHCDTPVHCAGVRLFAPLNENGYRETNYLSQGSWNNVFVGYRCCNCSKTVKGYALAVFCPKSASYEVAVPGKIYKYGERPPFGPSTPSRVMKMLGPERDDYLKGRRAESQGMGIGAFAYYRRVVENQKDRLLNEIIRVAQQIGASPEMLNDLSDAKNQTQFSTAVNAVKHGIPSALLLDGHNPLTLLHAALSKGLHAQTDEECLALATSIRVVLTDLSDRLGHALKERSELSAAVKQLMK